MKRIWQSWMIALARSPRVTRWMQGNRATASIARRFVAGADAAQAMSVARDLEQAGFKTSLYYLGEYVKDPAVVAENGRQKIAVAESLSAAHLQIHVSIDSTQIGYALDEQAGQALALKIGARIRELGSGCEQRAAGADAEHGGCGVCRPHPRPARQPARRRRAGCADLAGVSEAQRRRPRADHRGRRAGASGQGRVRRSEAARASGQGGDRCQLSGAGAQDAERGGEGERLPTGVRHA